MNIEIKVLSVVVGFLTILLVSTIVVHVTKRHTAIDQCMTTRVIKQVGGCSRYGMCGVLLDNGDTGKEYYPVIGQRVQAYNHDCYKEAYKKL